MGKWDKKHLGKRNIPKQISFEEWDDETTPYTKSHEQIKPKNCESCSRKMLTFPWKDLIWKGLLYKLLEYKDLNEYITEYQFGVMIHWKKRSVQNGFALLRDSQFNNYIEMKKLYYKGNERRAYKLSDNCPYDIGDFEFLVELVAKTHYKTKLGMNKCESYVFSVLESVCPGEWEYTGDILPENRIGNMYPDFRHKTKNLIIEFHGPYHHGLDFIDEDSLEAHDQKRVDKLKKHDKIALILREHHISQNEKDKKALNEFLKQFNDGLIIPRYR